MSKNLERPVQEPKPDTCQVVKNKAGFYCVRCNLSANASQGEQWACCPDCGGELRRKDNERHG